MHSDVFEMQRPGPGFGEHDVEAEVALGVAGAAHDEVLEGVGDALLLAGGYGFNCAFVRCAGFDFDGDYGVSARSDNVDFAYGGFVAASKDAVGLEAQGDDAF